MKYILVTGAREYPDRFKVEHILAHELFDIEHGEVKLIYGKAKGVDTWAAEIVGYFYPTGLIGFDPDWTTHKKAAGPIRNQQMVDYAKQKLLEGHAVQCLAFPLLPARKSSGTRDCIGRIKKAELPLSEFPMEAPLTAKD